MSWRRRSRLWWPVVGAALSALIAADCLYSWASFSGLPPLSRLGHASGQVEWVEEGRYGIKFGLKHSPQHFDYPSKGAGVGAVLEALSRDGARIDVYFEPDDPSGPIGSDRRYFSVYQVSADGAPVRTLAEVEAAWRRDERVGLAVGLAFAAIGLGLGVQARREFKRQRGYRRGLPASQLRR